MSNSVYQATVQELEAFLSPRVVSRSLQEGLRQAGRTPDSVALGDIETILKGPVYRQLQVSMPVTKAKQTIGEILERLGDAGDLGDASAAAEGAPAGAPAGAADEALARQREALDELRAAMRPFNLFFEWPEVQKLRAQVQLLESEQEAGREAPGLVEQSRAQLQVVEQKLEDQLVIQARELGELSDALEAVGSLGGAKVRRLEALVGQIESAQGDRQLAPAEIERARKLARDLRKLMESSVYAEVVPVAEAEEVPAAAQAHTEAQGEADDETLLEVDGDEDDLLEIDTAQLDPEVSARLLLLDVESERQDLDALLKSSENLLRYRPGLRERADELGARLDAGDSVTDALEAFAGTLRAAETEVRGELERELTAMRSEVDGLRSDTDTSELEQSLTVSLGILASTLPNASDIEHVRRLHRQALERAEELERLERETEAHRRTQLAEQADLVARLEGTLVRYSEQSGAEDEVARLVERVETLRRAQQGEELAPEAIAEARRAEEALEAAVAQRAQDARERQRARVRGLLAQVDALPGGEFGERVAPVRAELERQLAAVDDGGSGDGGERGGLDDVDLDAAERLVADLKGRVRASFRNRLDTFATRASELGDEALLHRLQSANAGLEEDDYPDLGALATAVEQASGAYRSEQRAALRDVERRAARFEGVDLPENAQLRGYLAEAREAIDAGDAVVDPEFAEALLERLEARIAERVEGVGERIDRALERFAPVSKLNNDDVATVRRILRHLDSQRESFGRVSVGLQLQLEASLREAEELLGKLQSDFEATREIADRLVAGNVLDDVLGLFGDGGDLFGGAADAPPPGALAGANDADDADGPDDVEGDAADGTAGATTRDGWIGALGREAGVRHAAVVRGGGLSGSAAADAGALDDALGRIESVLDELGREGRSGTPRMLTLETAGGALVVGWPGDGSRVLVQLEDPAVLNLVTRKLQREVPGLTAPEGGPAPS